MSDLINIKQVNHPTPAQLKRRQQIARLKASLNVPQHTSIKTSQQGKQSPASGMFGSI